MTSLFSRMIAFTSASLLMTTAAFSDAHIKLTPAEEVLVSYLQNSREKSAYLLLQKLRLQAGVDQFYDQADVDRLTAKQRSAFRAHFVQRFVAKDLDGNWEVTKQEVEAAAAQRRNRRKVRKSEWAVFGKYDSNSDGKVSLEELKAYPIDDEKLGRGVKAAYEKNKKLLLLDQNGDGGVGIKEAHSQITTFFDRFDKDGNWQLDKAERAVTQKLKASLYKKLGPRKKKRQFLKSCDLPKMSSEALIVAVGSYESGTLSSVSVSGQDAVTETTVINIEKGSQPLYVVAASFTPMIYQLQGAVERIEKFVVAGRGGRGGTVGVSRDKVTFLTGGGCNLSFYKQDSSKARLSEAVLSDFAKRPVNKTVGAYTLFGASLPSGKKLACPASKGEMEFFGPGALGKIKARSCRPKFGSIRKHAKTAHSLYRFSPGGLQKLDAEQVVSQKKAKDYLVFPQEAGLLQLLGSGHLRIMADSTYEIVKPIGRFPAGLAGAHSVKFMLGKDVPVPKGHPGHSCVLDANGRPVEGLKMSKISCRR